MSDQHNKNMKDIPTSEKKLLYAIINPKLDLVNMVVRHILFTKLSLFTKISSLNKE